MDEPLYCVLIECLLRHYQVCRRRRTPPGALPFPIEYASAIDGREAFAFAVETDAR
jgi:hypothetical protein